MSDPRGARRAVLKLSGGAFCRAGSEAIDEQQVDYVARELKSGLEACAELAVVVGGGNIMRGADTCQRGVRRVHADQCGMLATIINALMLKDHLQRLEVACSVFSAVPVEGFVDAFAVEHCLSHLAAGRLVLLAGGTGSPFFTTDTAAALRAIELGADIMLKGTRVDGVYEADPEKEKEAEFFARLSFQEVISRRLGVMDLTAVAMCLEHGLPVRVFNYSVRGNIRRALRGESVGTIIQSAKDGN